MSASVVLSQNTNTALDGLNLHWVVSNMNNVKEVTLIYYKNTGNSDILSMDLSPSTTDLNLSLESGQSYSFQLQVYDGTNTIYSNRLQLTAPYELSAPIIDSYVGRDNAVDLVVLNNGNSLTNQDSVEFVCRKPDNSIFWIIKPYAINGQYTLSTQDNALLVNNQIYRIACMFQPSDSNALYSSPSNMSNTMSVEPSNLPNDPTDVVIESVGTSTPALKATWTRPSDFNEWNNNFSIVLRLYNFVSGQSASITLYDEDVVEYTFNNLNRNDPYAVFIKYANVYGSGDEVESSPSSLVLSTVPDAPTITTVDEGDEQLTVHWIAPSYVGNSPITGYKLYRTSNGNGTQTIDISGNVLQYTDTGRANGVNVSYVVRAVNAIGESIDSNAESGNPYGNCSVVNVQATNKTLQITIAPNGRAIDHIYIVALDADPSQADDPAQFVYNVPSESISGALNGQINISKTFASFSSNIAFYCVFIGNGVSSDFLQSA